MRKRADWAWLSLGVLAVFSGASVWGGDAADDVWQSCREGYTFSTPELCCQVLPDGRIVDVKIGAEGIVDEIYFRGTYLVDGRFKAVQQAAPVSSSELQLRRSEKAIELRKPMLLGKKGEPVADCLVTLSLSSSELEASYTATLLTPLVSRSHIFMTHIRLREEAFSGRGARGDVAGMGPRQFIFPFRQAPAGGLKSPVMRAVTVALPERLLLLDTGDGTVLRLIDSPGWGGKFSAHVHRAARWFHKPVTHTEGTVFRWSFRLSLTDVGIEQN